MLIECKGIQVSKYFVPPFYLNKGEIVVIYLHRESEHYFDAMKALIAIFTGKVKNDGVHVRQQLTYADFFHESKMRELFYPVTVNEYLRRNSNRENGIGKMIYDKSYIKPTTRINTLTPNDRKLLSLYSTLSHTSDIVFDLTALFFEGIEAYGVVKKYVNEGGAAILIDWTDEEKNDCSKFIVTECLIS